MEKDRTHHEAIEQQTNLEHYQVTLLKRFSQWYFSADCVHNANERIISQMDEMELPNLYRRQKKTLHTSSDGQKFEIAVDSLNANYSFKYFGQGRGVSVYSFIDERHFLVHSTVISSAEREAAYDFKENTIFRKVDAGYGRLTESPHSQR